MRTHDLKMHQLSQFIDFYLIAFTIISSQNQGLVGINEQCAIFNFDQRFFDIGSHPFCMQAIDLFSGQNPVINSDFVQLSVEVPFNVIIKKSPADMEMVRVYQFIQVNTIKLMGKTALIDSIHPKLYILILKNPDYVIPSPILDLGRTHIGVIIFQWTGDNCLENPTVITADSQTDCTTVVFLPKLIPLNSLATSISSTKNQAEMLIAG